MVKRTIILGTGALALRLANELSSCRHYQLIGIVGETQGANNAKFPCPYLGYISDLKTIVEQRLVGHIILALERGHTLVPAELLIESQAFHHVAIEAGSKTLERLSGKLAIESLPGIPTLFSGEFRPKPLNSALCRAISIFIATTGLVLFLPLMTVIALAIRIDSPGPVLFIQERIGRGGKCFKFLKFRSMYHGVEKRSEWARDNRDEITRVGQLIRKFRMDELFQLVNVVRGDMNIVGPRPHPVSNRELFVLVARNAARCGEAIPYYTLRQSVRPGITGWAQVRYKYANGLDEEMEKLEYDLYYIKHYSPLFDIRILFMTVKVILAGHPERESSKPTTGMHARTPLTDDEGIQDGNATPSRPFVVTRVRGNVVTTYKSRDRTGARQSEAHTSRTP